MEKVRSLVTLDQIELGTELKMTLQELLDKVKDIHPELYRLISVKIGAEDLDPNLYEFIQQKSNYDDTELRNRIKVLEEIKAARSELEKYRLLSVKIAESDLTEDLAAKINAIIQGYDDRLIKEEIALLKEIKMDKTEASEFRKVYDSITLEDLDDETQSLLGIISELDMELTHIQENIVLKDDLKDYRRKVVDITIDDLSPSLRAIIENYVSYDDTRIKLAIEELKRLKADRLEMAKKSDKTYVDETFRRLDTSIMMEDLSEHLQSILENIAPEFDSKYIEDEIAKLKEEKAEKTYVDNYYRRITVPIFEADLDRRLVEKINRAISQYDDSVILNAINKLETHKVDAVQLNNYRHREVLITKNDLDKDLQVILTSCQHAGQEMRQYYHDLYKTKADVTELEKCKNRITQLENIIAERDIIIEQLVNDVNELKSKL